MVDNNYDDNDDDYDDYIDGIDGYYNGSGDCKCLT